MNKLIFTACLCIFVSSCFSQTPRLRAKDSIDNSRLDQKARSVMALIGVSGDFCTNSFLPGANASLLFRAGSHSSIWLGPSADLSKIHFWNETKQIPFFYTSYQVKTLDFGLRILKDTKRNIYLNFNPHLLIGKEKVATVGVPAVFDYYPDARSTGMKGDRRLLGLQLDGGLYYISPGKLGPYAGIDLVVRVTNSHEFNSDIGFKLSAGIKF